MKKRLYTIRRQDYFKAIELGQLSDGQIISFGSIWIELFLSDDEKANYKFPIALA